MRGVKVRCATAVSGYNMNRVADSEGAAVWDVEDRMFLCDITCRSGVSENSWQRKVGGDGLRSTVQHEHGSPTTNYGREHC